ncbi:MAG: coproporphyrinogen dehydrogenase HemZ, partial [Oscillospiraceae bacterium]|nr:coproporphyrinogen dehydrogenase HemZ [Oscillospiraceae bacterium]
ITVHSLALKRSARLEEIHGADACAAMLQTAAQLLPAAGYAPYYMYRQSRSLGNLENIGWALPGYACRYNVDMMEESHTILSCGAGGVTKLKQAGGDYLERIFGFKYPYEYLDRFEELMARKARIFSFYATYNTDI